MNSNLKAHQTLYSIQFLRAVAAYLVVAMHATEAMAIRMSNTPHDFWHYGSFGVDIFFVISGFVMEYLAKDIPLEKDQRTKASLSFLKKRFIRIVPLYWFYTVLKIALLAVFPAIALRTTIDFQHILSSFLFIPCQAPWGLMQPFLPVGWTLNFEMFFYGLFAVAIYLKANRVLFCLISFLLIQALGFFSSNDLISFYSQSIIFEFIVGMVIAKLLKNQILQLNPMVNILLILGAVAYLLLNIYFEFTGDRFLNYGLPAAFVVFGMLGLEKSLAKWPVFPRIAKSGDYSYTTYLAHTFIVPALPIIFIKLHLTSLILGFFIIILTTYIASYILYSLIEKRLLKFFQS